MKTKQEQTNKKQKTMLLLSVSVAVLAVMSAACVLFLHLKGDQPLAPDYAPEVEKNAVAIPDDTGESADASKGGGAVSLTYSDKVTVDLREETASLMFANPGKSNKSIVLQIIVQDKVIAQSGKIEPGKQVAELELCKDAEKLITLGGYHGKFAVFFYDLTSEEKAIVNTEIPVMITVK